MPPAPRQLVLVSILVVSLSGFAALASAEEVWTGDAVVFSKAGGADPSLAANQDRISPNVWITRGGLAGLYNALTEASYVPGSPAGTEWAAGDIADHATLTYLPWVDAVAHCPPCAVGVPYVLHLITEDIYIPVTMTDWGEGIIDGGRFSYTRGTPEAVATRPLSWGALKGGLPTAPFPD